MRVNRLRPTHTRHGAQSAGRAVVTRNGESCRVERRDRTRETAAIVAEHHHAREQHRPRRLRWQHSTDDLHSVAR